MSIVLVGLNHRTAPLAVRERIVECACWPIRQTDVTAAAEPDCGDRQTTGSRSHADPYRQPAGVDESVLVATCNRFEIYAIASESDAGLEALQRYLWEQHAFSFEHLRPHLYIMDGEAVVTHLMRVACGLDSMVLGEPQILGQVGRAFANAHAAGSTGPLLSHLFARAQHCGKRARTETGIASHTVSLSHAAADLVAHHPWQSPARVLIVGAGEMAELAAQALRGHGVNDLVFVNRSFAGAERLCERFGGSARPWNDMSALLAEVDAVVTATGAPHIVITGDEVAGALSQRAGRGLLLVDLALPRDIDPGVADLPDVMCYDLDRLNNALDENRALREAALPLVEAIVAEEAEQYLRWLRAREAVPTVVELKERAQRVAQAEVARSLRRLGNDPRLESELIYLTHRIVNKLLHQPTVRLKELAESGDGLLARHTIQKLFGLETDK